MNNTWNGSVISERMMCVAIMNACDNTHIFERHLPEVVDATEARLCAAQNKSRMHGVFESRFHDVDDVMNEVLDFLDACGYEKFMATCYRFGVFKTLKEKGEVEVPIPCKNAGLVYFKNPRRAPLVSNTIRLVFEFNERGLFFDPTGARGLSLKTAYPVL